MRSRLLPTAALILVLVAFPLAALADHQFGDVPNTNTFHNDIDAIADAGVTTGCGGGNYCPSAFVTREQMAAFMNRLGALGPGKTPVVDADRLDGMDSTAFLDAGDIVMSQFGPWRRGQLSTLPLAFAEYTTTIYVNSAGAGEALIQQELVHPASIGATNYGLSEVEICWATGTNNVVIDSLQVLQTHGEATVFTIQDLVNVVVSVAPGCHVWTASTVVASAGMAVLQLDLGYSAAGSFRPSNINSTWVPVP